MNENNTKINEKFSRDLIREVFETQRWFLFAKCTTLEVSGMFSLVLSKNPKSDSGFRWITMDYGGGGFWIT